MLTYSGLFTKTPAFGVLASFASTHLFYCASGSLQESHISVKRARKVWRTGNRAAQGRVKDDGNRMIESRAWRDGSIFCLSKRALSMWQILARCLYEPKWKRMNNLWYLSSGGSAVCARLCSRFDGKSQNKIHGKTVSMMPAYSCAHFRSVW